MLEEDGLTAICKVVIKDREALAALDPFGDTMLMTTLHWPDEIRSTGELDLPDEEFDFKPAEIAMAKQLVGAMTAEFDPSQYKDEYREALQSIIDAKVDGQETVEIEAPEEGGKLIDLMAALEASVNAAKAARDGRVRSAGLRRGRARGAGRQGCEGREGRGCLDGREAGRQPIASQAARQPRLRPSRRPTPRLRPRPTKPPRSPPASASPRRSASIAAGNRTPRLMTIGRISAPR